MKKPVLISIIIGVVVIAAAGIIWFPRKAAAPSSNNSNQAKKPAIISQAEDQFTFKANTIDTLGADPNTTFTLQSKQPIKAKTIEANLKVAPTVTYKIESSDNNTFTVTPKEPLQPNTVYSFSIATEQASTGNTRQYSWAYQIKDTFKITGTLPRHRATGVPTNTGIEITFSNENYATWAEYVSISPSVEGTFEKHRKTLAFVPRSLQPNTVYSVTVKHGLPVTGSQETLADDYIFQFETSSPDTSGGTGHLSFDSSFFEYPVSEKPVLTLYEYNTGLAKVDVNVWRYPSYTDFTNAVTNQAKAIPLWAYSSWQRTSYTTAGLEKTSTFSADLKSSDYYKFIEFPETLDAGQYLIETSYGEQKVQTLLQVTNLTAFFQGSTTKGIIWVHDLGTKQPVDDVTLAYSADAQFKEKTNNDGLSTFDAPAGTKPDQSDGMLTQLTFFTATRESDQLLIPVEQQSGYWGYGGTTTALNQYWTYLYANRNLYQTSDSVKFWGIAKKRNGGAIESLTVKLMESSYSEQGSKDITIASVPVTISEFGTVEGSISYQNLNPGGYRLEMYDGTAKLATTYIEIQTYVKPAYTIEVSTPKRAIFQGENAVFNIKSKFFDGTPVAKLELKYTGEYGDGTVTTDANGDASLAFKTSYTGTENDFPQYSYFSIFPVRAELADLSSSMSLYEFGPRMMVTATTNSEHAVTGTINEVTLDSINGAGQEFTWDFRGKPVPDHKTHVRVVEQYYEKIESGTTYDFINKRTVTNYNYEPREKFVIEGDVTTDKDGAFTYSFKQENNKSYKVTIETKDNDGRTAVSSVYVTGSSFLNPYGGSENYYLSSEKETAMQLNEYAIGDTVKLSFRKNDEILPTSDDKNYLYFKDHAALLDIGASREPTVQFDMMADYVPSVVVSGVYFDGRSYHQGSNMVLYDKERSSLTIEATPDQASYTPGSQVTLGLKVTDADKKPVVAEVNVSLIDEALAAIEWSTPLETLSRLYSPLTTTLTTTYTSHKAESMPAAERGGCFTAGTLIAMADGTRKPIERVRTGDLIVTRSSPTIDTPVTAKVLGTTERITDDYLTFNNSLNITPLHILLINGKWSMASQARLGDYLTVADGNHVSITNITRHRTPTTVYNLTTSEYHTFLANNIYVHNEKGGARQDFQDIAFFGSVTTDTDGTASVQFKLPDNITSWQTTIQAITKDLQAYGTRTAIIATKGFFVDVANADSYLAADKPTVKIRAFGKNLTAGDVVSYDISFDDGKITSDKKNAKAFEPIEVVLPTLTEGKHTMTVKGTSGSNTDTVIKTISIRSSNMKETIINYLTLDANTKPTGNPNGQTELTFQNKERGQYFSLLEQLVSMTGDRVDQRVAHPIAQQLLNTYFSQSAPIPDLPFSSYQTYEGGVALLPYASAELLLTAKSADVAPNLFDSNAAKQYFTAVLNKSSSNTDEIVYALYGLANLDEPVLTDMTNFLQNQPQLPNELKLYLARGIANLGATEYAKTILTEILKTSAETVAPYIRVNLGTTPDDIIENTYQAATLAAAVSAPEAQQLFDYAMAHPADEQLGVLDQLAYMETKLPLLSGQAVSFSYSVGGKTQNISLKNNETKVLSLNAQDLTAITFSNITGAIGLTVRYEKSADAAGLQSDGNLGLKRTYSVNGKATTTFKEDDVVMITIQPTIKPKSVDTEYQITDYLPAGLRLLSDTYSRNVPYDQLQQYPYEVNGQQVKFWTGKPAKEFHYYAIVVGKGEYQAEPTMMQGFIVPTSRTSTSQSTTITIQ